MFLTFSDQQVLFEYGSKSWQYPYSEIAVLGMLRKQRTYYMEKTAFGMLFAVLYYYLFFTGMDYLPFVIPGASSVIAAAVIRFRTAPPFDYYVIVKDHQNAALRIKIKMRDKKLISSQLSQYEKLRFENNIPRRL